MQVCSWKRMECTSGLARFVEFNFSDQHAICLKSRKREFEGSVAQTMVVEEEEEGGSEVVWLNQRFNHHSLNQIHPVLQCVVPSEFV